MPAERAFDLYAKSASKKKSSKRHQGLMRRIRSSGFHASSLQAVAVEQERRQALATIPAQVAQPAARFVDGGGDPADIIAAAGGA